MVEDTQATDVDAPDTTADTAITQPSEASDQIENKAPEATLETEAEEAQPTEVKAEDTVEEKLLAGKYKTVDDLEKAYKSAEAKLHTEASEKAELARILNESFATPEPVSDTDAYESDEPNLVNQEIEGLKRVTAVQSFIMSHQDADADSMKEVLASDPLVKQISGHEAKLEYAYLRSKNTAQPKAIEEAQKQATQATQAKIVEKQTAQVESAQSSEQIDENSELYEKATGNYSQEDRDQARRELIRKNLVNL